MQKELSKKELLVELENSRKQVYTLEQEKADLEILQEMTSEHCDEFELQIMEKVAERTRELHEKNKSLIKLNKEKNEFLGIAAHDLKNPLSVIKGFSEEIQEAFDDLTKEEIILYVDMIQKSSQKMFQLITNLLDVNMIESGSMNLSLALTDILPTVQALAESYADRAKVKNISVQFQHSEKEYKAFVDKNIVHQVMDNLISNAVKYSPCGKQTAVRLDQSAKHVRCEIQDQGPGLNKEDKQKLFGKFNRLTAQPTGGEHSTGLGLFIVKKLMESMHGKVWCESEPGQGATFIVEFPTND